MYNSKSDHLNPPSVSRMLYDWFYSSLPFPHRKKGRKFDSAIPELVWGLVGLFSDIYKHQFLLSTSNNIQISHTTWREIKFIFQFCDENYFLNKCCQKWGWGTSVMILLCFFNFFPAVGLIGSLVFTYWIHKRVMCTLVIPYSRVLLLFPILGSISI